MDVYLIRHAIAEDRAASGRDADRALTREGRAKMKRAAAGLSALGVRVDVVLTSPFRRAVETAEIVAREIEEPEVRPLPELASGGDLGALLAALRRWRDRGAIALVGHQPDLGTLASQILAGSPDACCLPFKKGGVAAIDAEDGGARLRGRLRWFITPGQLRAIRDGRVDDGD